MTKGKSQRPKALYQICKVLWHLDIFRRSFRDLSGHACMADSCIFCALKELFAQLQFSTETALPPDALRRALAESFFDQNRFQLGFMDDAAECFENMLLRIHTHIAQGEAEDMCNARHCIPHQKFAMTLVEQSVCGSCGATSEPLSYTQMVHYVSTSTLVYQVRSNAGRSNPEPFGQLLKKAGDMGDIRTCPSACGAVIQIGRTLMNNPEIVSVGLVWNSERPTLEHIMEVFSTIGTTLRLGDVFNTVVDTRWAETSMHNLVGVVTYYGKHYSTFFFHTKLRVWIYFDDATVREVGPRWEQVVEKCRKGRYQPLLLLYALPDGTPVNTDNAPKQITPLLTERVNKKPPQSVLRRSVTPSPEKPMIGTTRRAITPNPDGTTANQKPPLPRQYNEYQNLSIIQNNIYQPQEVDVVDGNMNRKEPEYAIRKMLEFTKPNTIHRTLSNGSSSGLEGMSIPDHMNVPRRRDSGNWSGDRNSASSASSTTMENPYLYLVGKMPNGGGSVPGSPTRIKSDSSSGSSGVYDAGYDSYSLSSNDSSTMTTLQHLMKMGHLAKIPEDYNNCSTNQNSPSCDILCDEADELLVKSRQLEDEHDLVLALALCNAAATKARAAMNAPYNNPQTLTLARMKHNTCIMRARSLHRRMTQVQAFNKENQPEIRHTREGSCGSGRHSRQNSRDKGNHSRQNSKELLVPDKEKLQPTKNIEIYATLPKKKDGLKNKLSLNSTEDEEYMLYDKPANRESRSIFSRTKNKDQKNREKRSRSEDRNKLSKDFSLAPEIFMGKDTLKKAKEEKDDKKDKDGKSKKQHKIRRKLLMGGLIKRKNRSMPDLTDAVKDTSTQPPATTVDDSNLGLKGSSENQASMCGYLSEGHLEFAGNNPNPNLERSKLMRKSFHGSAGKILTAAKVPPPPPLRTTSQLSTSKLNGGEVCDESERLNYTQQNGMGYYQDEYHYMNQSPVSLPYFNNSFSDESFYNDGPTTVITRADVHQEHNSEKLSSHNIDSGVDEVDCFPTMMIQNFELPPYPSPMGSVVHSRQASEDFPAPPPPLDLSALDEHLPQISQPSTLLSQLQNKRQEILSQDSDLQKITMAPVKSSGDTWLKELQAKQAILRSKKNQNDASTEGIDVVNTQRYLTLENKVKSVKDLASKFETTEPKLSLTSYKPLDPVKSDSNGVLSMKKREEPEPIAPEQIAEELREVEMLNAAVQKTLSANQDLSEDGKKRLTKKKSVSFCDQVILVATADEQEDDSFIPNPILERVLRTAMNKPETEAIRQEIMSLRENELKEEKAKLIPQSNEVYNQPLYVRRNSVDNLLSKPNGNIEQPLQRQSPTCNQPIYNMQNSYHNQNLPHYNGQPNPNPQYNHSSYVVQGHPQLLRQNSQGDVPGRQIYPNEQYNTQQSPFTGQNNVYDNQCTDDCYINQNQHYNSVATAIRQSPYQPIPQNSPSYQPIPQNSPSYQTVPRNSPSYQPIPQNSHSYQPVQQNSSVYQPIPQNSPAYQPIPQNSPAYQPIPQNSPAYHSIPQNIPAYQSVPPNSHAYSALRPNTQNQQYATSPRSGFSPHIRQSTPSPMNGYLSYMNPSPAPSNVSSNYNYHQSVHRGYGAYEQPNQNAPYQRVPHPDQISVRQLNESPMNHVQGRPQNEHLPQSSPYQRVPMPADQLAHQRSPQSEYEVQQGMAHQRVPHSTDVYQRIPHPHPEQDFSAQGKYSLYQHAPALKQILKKTVSFEPGTKGGSESPVPRAVVTPIVVNNANNSVPTDKTKCNLCRKKNVVASNLYCQDCEFYMSRFKPRS